MAEKAKFEFVDGKDGEHYWHLRAAGATTENEIIATGEGYSSRKAAEEGVEAVKRGVLSALGINPRARLMQTELETIEEADGTLSTVEPRLRHFVEVDELRVDELPL